MGDLSVLDPDVNRHLLSQLNPNVVLVGLNISTWDIEDPFANFHSKRPVAQDYKIRFAVKDTDLWGAYMTDIVKDYPEKESGKVGSYLRQNRKFREENVQRFRQD